MNGTRAIHTYTTRRILLLPQSDPVPKSVCSLQIFTVLTITRTQVGCLAHTRCWNTCGAKRGYCNACVGTRGTHGACCKRGDKGDPAECASADPSSYVTRGHHECVLIKKSSGPKLCWYNLIPSISKIPCIFEVGHAVRLFVPGLGIRKTQLQFRSCAVSRLV